MAENKEVVMLTTIDNPFDPFDQFSQWYLFDMEKGYNTCAYLARISDDINSKSVEEAIDEIIRNDFLNLYKKVIKSETKKDSKEEELEDQTQGTPGGS